MAEEALELLEEALAAENLWSVERLMQAAVDHGLTEAMNMLAFETSVDLEPIRTALATLQAASATMVEKPQSTSAGQDQDKIHAAEVEAAIAAFEQAQKTGKDLNERFEELEQTLGLPVGDSQPYAEITQGVEVSAEAMGPDAIPGMSMWLATFLWEKEAQGITTEEPEAREISSFLEHLQNTRGAQLDPEEVQPGDLLGYMLRSENSEVLDHRLNSLANFVSWLIEEQGSPLQETMSALSESTGSLLRDVVKLNHLLEQRNAAKESVAWLKSVEPLKVGAEDGEMVPVVGIPEDCTFQPTIGDCLMGMWHNAQFHLGAWLPEQLLPKPQSIAE
jgi:hypothetical protein